MTDATEAIAHVRRLCEMPYPDTYSGHYGFGTMHTIIAHIDAQAAEIERLRVERDALKADSEMLVMYGKKIKALRAERDDIGDTLRIVDTESSALRDALIAAMEIVQEERVRIAYNAKGAPPAIEIGYADILHRLDALIAQADAALGAER